MKKMRLISLSMLMIVYVLIQSSCKKDHDRHDQGNPPQIPPSSTFLMKFSELDSAKIPGGIYKTELDSKSVYSNYLYSAGNVFVWNAIITVGLAVPVASFLNSFNYQAVWNNSENAWIWQYSFTVYSDQFTAKLKAKIVGNQVHWEMYISNQNGFQDFLWYSGDSMIDGTEGTWTLYDNPISNTELLGILWHRNVSLGTSDITYTNIVPGGPENGGYISYGITTDSIYNAYYDIFNKGKNNHTNIKWNQTYKNGRVCDSLHFGDTNWHCWDVDYTNIVCQ